MSLIVAKAVDGHIYCMGDTKVTYKNEAKSEPILKGCLKQYIFNDLLICFAGCLHSFEEDIESYRGCTKVEEVVAIATRRAIKYEIMVAAPADNHITTIKNRSVSTSIAGFIGDHSGFEAYQMHYHHPQSLIFQPGYGEIRILRIPEPVSDRLDYDRSYMALRSVIHDSGIQSVGGAIVSISTHQGTFQYMMYCDIFTDQVIVPESGQTKLIEFGSGEGGGCALEFSDIRNEDEEAFPTFYFLQGGIGIVFPSKIGRTSEPTLVRAENPCAWALATREIFNRTAISGYLTLDHCGIEGEKKLAIGNFEGALEGYKLRLDAALRSDFTDPKIDMYLSGYYVSLFNSGFRDLAVSELGKILSTKMGLSRCSRYFELMNGDASR